MPASGSRAAPLRGLTLQLYKLFVHPIFQGVAILGCALVFYYNQTALKPYYAQRNSAELTSNNLLLEKNKLRKMMPDLRIEDLNRQMDVLKTRLVLNENQVNAEAKKIGKKMQDLEWLGDVVPKEAVQSFPSIPFLKHYPIEVEIRSPPEIASKIEEKDMLRLFQLLREVESTRKLHYLKTMNIEADPVKGWTVKMEYDFFMIEEPPRG